VVAQLRLVRSMTRIAIVSALTLALTASADAQTPTPAIVVRPAKDVAIYAPKPDYPLAARSRHLQGSGIFLLHVRPDGTVEGVDVIKSTGHSELDQSGVAAFLKWRFRPGVNEVEIPLEFTMRGLRQGAAQAPGTPADGVVSKLDRQAKEAFSHENYDATIRFSTDALQLAPLSPTLRYRRAVAYYRKGETDNAIKDINEVIRLEPTLGPAYVDRGAYYARKGWKDKALADFNEAIRLGPRDARAYCDRADLEGDLLRQPDNALADYNQAIRLAPNFQRAYCDRGAHFLREHDYGRTIADLTRAIRLMPNDLGAYAARAYAYARQGDRAHALADATAAIKLKPATAFYYNRGVDFQLRARAYEIIGQPELALHDLREALRLTPRDPLANGELAWFLATCPEERFRNGAEAVSIAKEACEMSQWEHSGLIDALAAAYAELGDFDQATKYEQQSLNDRLLAVKEKEEREKRLGLYQQRKAFREQLSVIGKP
jgi:TonB family protein